MRAWLASACILAATLAAAPAMAEDCAPGEDPDAVIEACNTGIGADEAIVDRLAQRYEARAGAYETIGEYDLAVADYEAAIRLNPAPNLRFKLANTHLRLGDPSAALLIYDQLLSDGVMLMGLHNNRGNALEGLGRYEEAVAAWLSSMEVDGEESRELWRDYLVQQSLLPEGATTEVDADFEAALMACAVSEEC